MRPLPRALLAVAAAGLVVAVYLLAWQGVPSVEQDSAGYLEVAGDLADGGLDRPYMRAPGYPAFLVAAQAVEGPGALLVALQIALHLASVALFAALLAHLGASARARAVFVVVALLPPFVEHARFVLSEAVTSFCVAAGLVGAVRWLLGGRAGWLVLAAAALAAVGLVHPTYQLLWLLIPVLGLLFRAGSGSGFPPPRRLAAGAALLAALAVPTLAAVSFSNYQRFGFFGVSPMLGATLSHKTVRVVERLPEAYAPVRDILLRHRDAALLDPKTQHLGQAYIFGALGELEARTGLRGPALDRYLVGMNLELIRRAPMDYVDEVLRSSVWYWSPGATDVSAFGVPGLKPAWNGLRSAVLLSFLAGVALLSGPALLFAAARRRGAAATAAGGLEAQLLFLWLALGVIAYSWILSTALTAAVYRLRIPVDLPILAVAVLAPGVFGRLAGALGVARPPARS